MTYQYIVIDAADPTQITGTNVLADATSFMNQDGYIVLDTVAQLTMAYNPGIDVVVTAAIPTTVGIVIGDNAP